MQLTYGALIPLPIDEAFDFVSTPANWPTFLKSLESAKAGAGWGALGGRAEMVSRLMGRTVVTDLELVAWERPYEFRYIGRSKGRPDMDNRRVFEAVPEGTRLTGTTIAHPRSGFTAPVDMVYYLALRLMMRRGMKALPGQAVRWQQNRP